jgi:hypothetical protein
VRPVAYQPELRPRTLPELFDLAFILYRAHLGAFLSTIAFSFLGLGAFGLNYMDLGALPFETWLGVFALGMTPPEGPRLRAALGREFFFADGAIFWALASALLGPIAARAYLLGGTQPHDEAGSMIRGDIWLLAILVGLPIVLLRLAGVAYLADLLRFPALLAPHVMILEHQPLGASLRRSWALMRRDLPRTLAVFGVSLALVRLGAAMPFAGLLLLHRAAPEMVLRPGLYLLPLALLVALLVYPAAHIAVTLLYYDLRIRREGLDIALAAGRDGNRELKIKDMRIEDRR